MEIWFIAAVAGAVLAGISNFYFKQAAVRNYNPELFSTYSSICSVAFVCFLLLLNPTELFGYGFFGGVAFFAGFLASFTNIFKVQALRSIDSTIYFPLFKLMAPTIAIIAGVFLFSERFTGYEWFGMILGLLVPLLLITKSENRRQNNLALGLILVSVTSVTSAGTSIANKYASEALIPVEIILLYASVGIFVGGIVTILYKNGVNKFASNISEHSSWGLVRVSCLRAVLISSSFWLILFAFANNGPLAVVQVVNSMYILIPIILSIIFYQEHWNLQKVIAIVLSVVSLAFLG